MASVHLPFGLKKTLTGVSLGRETSTVYAGWKAISRARKRKVAKDIYMFIQYYYCSAVVIHQN